ncbi:MAG TPA: hypothetical protein VG246_06600 [Acidimicrobiales bacterium]|nr:hypothetical protein [Acidimicrobiales bacterium]
MKLDLRDIYNRGGGIDRALRAIIDEAIENRVRVTEIRVGGERSARRARFLSKFAARRRATTVRA